MAKGFKPVEVGGKELSCANKEWPPVKVLVYGEDLEEIRPMVTPSEYHKLKTWEKVCGLTAMDPEKCPGCPYVLIDGIQKTQFGTGRRVALGRNYPRKAKKG